MTTQITSTQNEKLGWLRLIMWIYDHKFIGDTITRHELLVARDEYCMFITDWTIDSYRQFLETAGYLKRAGWGKYTYVKAVGHRLTMQGCRVEAYGPRRRY